MVRGLLVLVAAGAVFAGMKLLERLAMSHPQGADEASLCVKMVDLPQWIPRSLAQQIAGDIVPPDADLSDLDLAERIYHRAIANPWIRSVKSVSRCPPAVGRRALVELRAKFRKPVALAAQEGRFFFVDAEGYRVPDEQVPRWVVTVPPGDDAPTRQVCYVDESQVPRELSAVRIHYIVIDGVALAPPDVGAKWEGDDLAAGLKLLELLLERRYANQITVVDVRNYAGRISRSDPHLRMYAQVGRDAGVTDIRFGRFPDPGGGDYVVSTQRKMAYIDEYVADHGGRLAGINEYLDLRYDGLHVSIN